MWDDIHNERTFDKRAQWSKATLQDIDRYKCMLNDQLSNINVTSINKLLNN